ncbi:CAAX amino terminal protease family [Marinitoga piezophila KA3]|uniref:CAAX amino terminal protease family n=1 Tax=Marinitoga piezophila (strain DSM 14283 / JCM 11233 / KA3) TaxID=443254 RepID=H2J627_MARPK|nr:MULTISPECIES: CPBP family intramembrane glutamic endopeptidase [Marinitoga]AEX85088.1 CAAX amino terminal protease family [Marinitoga piezophila KA3]APT75593.1 hypothetical protein LN42_03700 [Marinitoga sp. 1137]
MQILILAIILAAYFLFIYLIEKKYPLERASTIKIIFSLILIPIAGLKLYTFNLQYLKLLSVFVVYGIAIITLPEKIIKSDGLRIYLNKNLVFLIPLSAAITEEVLFRGILNTYLIKILNMEFYSVLISSFLFAMVHIFNVINGMEKKKYFFISFPLRFGFGLFFSYIYFEYGIINAILLHFLIDFPALYRIYNKRHQRFF